MRGPLHLLCRYMYQDLPKPELVCTVRVYYELVFVGRRYFRMFFVDLVFFRFGAPTAPTPTLTTFRLLDFKGTVFRKKIE